MISGALGGAARSGAVLALACVVVLALAVVSCTGSAGSEGGRVIVLGFDGMDHGMVTRLMAEGRLPNLSRLADAGGFSPLETSVPPQSPVAWSDFITGMDAGGHGIFDFVHRDPETMLPYLSTSRAETSEDCWGIGRWKVPGPGGEIELLRRGTPFWEVLEEHGVESWIIRMPANFPPSGSASYELSGMGTPDAVGSPGEFSFYTSELFAFEGEDISGGEIYPVDYWEGLAEGTLYGPPNPCLPGQPQLSRDFTVHVDPEEPLAKLVVDDEQRLLMVGEWSDWLSISFPLPLGDLRVKARVYLKSVRPELELYVTPFQIDPEHPAMPISTPEGFAGELVEATGSYYTQGMPEDTKALTGGVLDEEEFLQQAAYTGGQFIEQYKWMLERFDGRFLFYYFGNLDQTSHMLWDTLDPGHPAYVETDARFAGVIESIYEELDGVVGYTLDRIGDDTTLVVMSDHGFGSWRRVFHLNNWLEENGYLVLKDPSRREVGIYRNVDWSRTRAYGLGLNGLFVNLQGRERNGIVPSADRAALVEEITEKLLATVDPETGEPAVTEIWPRERYRDRGYLEIGPDVQIGYAGGTRGSGKSAIGDFTDSVFSDNLDDWPGDHCWDHTTVPGVLLTNRDLDRPVARLTDLAGAILAQFGVEDFPGRPQERGAGG